MVIKSVTLAPFHLNLTLTLHDSKGVTRRYPCSARRLFQRLNGVGVHGQWSRELYTDLYTWLQRIGEHIPNTRVFTTALTGRLVAENPWLQSSFKSTVEQVDLFIKGMACCSQTGPMVYHWGEFMKLREKRHLMHVEEAFNAIQDTPEFLDRETTVVKTLGFDSSHVNYLLHILRDSL